MSRLQKVLVVSVVSAAALFGLRQTLPDGPVFLFVEEGLFWGLVLMATYLAVRWAGASRVATIGVGLAIAIATSVLGGVKLLISASQLRNVDSTAVAVGFLISWMFYAVGITAVSWLVWKFFEKSKP